VNHGNKSELIAPLIYVAGPYRGAGPAVVQANVQRARDAMAALMAAGYATICPHTMTHLLEFYPGLDDETYLRQGLEQLRRCDAMIVLPGWSDSQGTQEEINHALQWGIPLEYIEGREWGEVYDLLGQTLEETRVLP
jgi:hypothetical protein